MNQFLLFVLRQIEDVFNNSNDYEGLEYTNGSLLLKFKHYDIYLHDNISVTFKSDGRHFYTSDFNKLEILKDKILKYKNDTDESN